MVLGRSVKHKNALLRNLATALIKHESIVTTEPKLKLTQRLVENLITKLKNNKSDIAKAKIQVGAKLFEPNFTLPKVFETLVPRYENRDGGYTRILKLEPRLNDSASQCVLEFVDNKDRELKYWLMARLVARLELQELPINKLTQQNVEKITRTQEDRDKFRETVEICKKTFYSDKSTLENLPRLENESNGFNKRLTNFKIVPRPKN